MGRIRDFLKQAAKELFTPTTTLIIEEVKEHFNDQNKIEWQTAYDKYLNQNKTGKRSDILATLEVMEQEIKYFANKNNEEEVLSAERSEALKQLRGPLIEAARRARCPEGDIRSALGTAIEMDFQHYPPDGTGLFYSALSGAEEEYRAQCRAEMERIDKKVYPNTDRILADFYRQRDIDAVIRMRDTAAISFKTVWKNIGKIAEDPSNQGKTPLQIYDEAVKQAKETLGEKYREVVPNVMEMTQVAPQYNRGGLSPNFTEPYLLHLPQNQHQSFISQYKDALIAANVSDGLSPKLIARVGAETCALFDDYKKNINSCQMYQFTIKDVEAHITDDHNNEIENGTFPGPNTTGGAFYASDDLIGKKIEDLCTPPPTIQFGKYATIIREPVIMAQQAAGRITVWHMNAGPLNSAAQMSPYAFVTEIKALKNAYEKLEASVGATQSSKETIDKLLQSPTEEQRKAMIFAFGAHGFMNINPASLSTAEAYVQQFMRMMTEPDANSPKPLDISMKATTFYDKFTQQCKDLLGSQTTLSDVPLDIAIKAMDRTINNCAMQRYEDINFEPGSQGGRVLHDMRYINDAMKASIDMIPQDKMSEFLGAVFNRTTAIYSGALSQHIARQFVEEACQQVSIDHDKDRDPDTLDEMDREDD